MLKKHINAKGLFFTRPSIAHYTMTREELVESAKKVFDAVLSEKFKVKVFKKYSLSEAKKAHEELEARLLTGPCSNHPLISLSQHPYQTYAALVHLLKHEFL